MKTSIYLDTRRIPGGEPAPLKFCISSHGRRASLSLGLSITPDHWDGSHITGRYAGRQTDEDYLTRKVAALREELRRAELAGELHGLTAADIAARLRDYLSPQDTPKDLLISRWTAFTARKDNIHTRELYATAWRRIAAYDANASRLRLDDITRPWLDGFAASLRTSIRGTGGGRTATNGRAVYLRCLRAVMADAVADGVTDNYPFRRWKIPTEATAHRTLTAEELRWVAGLDLPPWLAAHRDAFLLIFLLIGINVSDLYGLRPSDYYDGRIHYRRNKTGRLYSVKVCPMAAALIERWNGEEYLLRFAEVHGDAKSYTHALNDGLSRIFGRRVTTYYARHSWATIAASLDIPVESISAALGHQYGAQVTSIYIRPDDRKADEANARVVGYVFGE